MKKALEKMTKTELLDAYKELKADTPAASTDGMEAVIRENDELRSRLAEKGIAEKHVGIRNITPANIWLPDPAHLSGNPEDANKGRLLKGYKSVIVPAHWLEYYIMTDLPSFRDHECVVDQDVVTAANPGLVIANTKLPEHWREELYTDDDIKTCLEGDRTKLFEILKGVPDGILNRFLEGAIALSDEETSEGIAMSSIVTEIEGILNRVKE